MITWPSLARSPDRKPPRRKRDRESTHDQMLRVADLIEARGDKEKADLIRTLAKDRFRAIMTYGQKRRFARILLDEEILILPPPKPFPFLK
jgi:hypothetical protein